MKRILLTISMLLIMVVAFAQNQISELAKGMVFHAPLSEWYPLKDLVTGISGTTTSTYPIAGRNGDGENRYYSFNGTSDYIELTTPPPAFGSADFSVTGKIKTGAIGSIRTIIGGATNSFELYISATGYLTAIKYGGAALTASTTLLVANTEYTFAYVRSGAAGVYYVNGLAAGTNTDSNNYSVACTLVGKGTGYFDGYQFMLRAFNYALSSITNYSKPEYPIEYSDRDGAGNLCVLNLAAEGLAKASDGSYNTGYWTDRTNSITATVSGATSVIPPASNLNATYLNGTSSYLDFGDNDNYTITTNKLTISAWVNILSNSTYFYFVSKIKSSNVEYAALVNLDGNVNIGLYDSGQLTNNSEWLTSYVVPNNIWTHIAFTYENTVGKIYINGALVSATKTNAGSGFSSFSNTTAKLFIGNNDYVTRYANGLISNVQIWKYAKSSDEVKFLYDLGH